MMEVHIASSFLIVLFSAYLICSRKYEDGLVGRAGLALLAFSSYVVLLRLAEGFPIYPSPTEVTTNLGLVTFMGWHAFRFSLRVFSGKGRAGDVVKR